jgi:hypothetical protein
MTRRTNEEIAHDEARVRKLLYAWLYDKVVVKGALTQSHDRFRRELSKYVLNTIRPLYSMVSRDDCMEIARELLSRVVKERQEYTGQIADAKIAQFEIDSQMWQPICHDTSPVIEVHNYHKTQEKELRQLAYDAGCDVDFLNTPERIQAAGLLAMTKEWRQLLMIR